MPCHYAAVPCCPPTPQVHIKERTVLLQVFAAVLGKRHTELGPPDKVGARARAWATVVSAVSPAGSV